MSRLSSLPGRRFDLAIIGGGIIGAGIARDAALRGLRVVLFERADYGSGTTAGSTRLIHGGLRYLEHLELGLVRLDLREREILLRIAPHLVKPLPFLLPFYNDSRLARLRVRLGLQLYDVLSFDKSLPRHRMLGPEQMASLEPHLDTEGLRGAALYYDAQAVLPERLCLENILDARAHGAETFNYATVVGSVRRGSRVTGVHVRERLDGDEVDVEARLVVNAAGPWLDRVAACVEPGASPRLRTTQGIHIAVPPLVTHAIALRSAVDGRLMFAIPWLDHTWIGTTDTDVEEDPAEARAQPGDVDYLLQSVQPYFPELRARDIRFASAGVRALVREEGAASDVSRFHRVVDGDRTGTPGLISIAGSKLTGYRAIAEQATDLACRKLGVSKRAETAERPLPGAVTDDNARTDRVAATPAEAALTTHLERVYGTRTARVLQLVDAERALGGRVAPEYPDIAAQVIFAVREEQALTVSDVVLRRTSLGFTADRGVQAAEQVAALMARELGWSPARYADEIRVYYDGVAASHPHRDRDDRESAIAEQ